MLTSCRNSVDSAVTKNVEVIENMTKLLDDLKSNTDSMKTISPTLTESIDTVSTGTKIQIDELEQMKIDHINRSDAQANAVRATTTDMKNDFDGNKIETSKMIESINNHTKLFGATMKSSKVKILEQFDKQKTNDAAAFNSIKTTITDGIEKLKSSSLDIVDGIRDADKNLNDDSQNGLNFKNTVTTFVQSFDTTSKKKLDILKNIVVNFHNTDLKVYSSSGEFAILFFVERILSMNFNSPFIVQVRHPLSVNSVIRKFSPQHRLTSVSFVDFGRLIMNRILMCRCQYWR